MGTKFNSLLVRLCDVTCAKRLETAMARQAKNLAPRSDTDPRGDNVTPHRKLLPSSWIALLAAAGLAPGASAFPLDTGNDNLKINWDTTLQANLGWRADRIDPVLGNDVNSHQSDYKFPERGDMWQQRLDMRTELDVVWRGNWGARISAAGWYDRAYENRSYGRNPDIPVLARRGSYDATLKRFYNGPSGEVLDAFVFGSIDLPGGRDISLRLGQHALVWGVSQASLGEAISWGQQPYNLRKSAEIPGLSPKELAMPLNQLSFQSQIFKGMSLAGYYQFDWRGNRLSEGGTFLGSSDFLWSGNSAIAGAIPRTAAHEPHGGKGNYGLQLELMPSWLEGTVALIYRKFDEKQPWPVLFDGINRLDTNGDGRPDMFVPSGFHQSYARNVQIFGVSGNTVVGGISVGGELHYRKGGALASTSAVGRDGPTGDTWHMLVNGQKLLGSTPLWDSATLVVEAGYTRLSKVRTRPDMFNGSGYGCTGGVAAGCASRDTLTASVIFQPTWLAVWPGVDLTGNFVVANYGLKGNTPNLVGGKQRSLTYQIGISADIDRAYKISLQYADSAARRPEGTTDRGRIGLSLTTTF